MAAALYGGVRAGVLTTLLSAVIADYFLIEPVGSLVITRPIDLLALGVFIATGLMVSLVTERLWQKEIQLRRTEVTQRRDVERQVAERTAELTKEIAERKRLEEQLREMTRTDPLTELANRRASEEAIESEFLRSKRFGSDTSLLMVDIDHFKQINDVHGHEAGDRALVALARILKGVARSIDLPARFGGEEFVVLLVNTNLFGAKEMAERIQLAVAEIVAVSPRGAFGFTVSIGVASFMSEDENWTEALRRADQAMYRAKESGRNTVMISEI
jgi:diguanylate cyclase (GGDEF)-like protein